MSVINMCPTKTQLFVSFHHIKISRTNNEDASLSPIRRKRFDWSVKTFIDTAPIVFFVALTHIV